MSTVRTRRWGPRAVGLLAALAATLAVSGAGGGDAARAAAFEPGSIVVSPDDTAFNVSTVEFPVGPDEVPLKMILAQAADKGSIDLATYPRVTIGSKSYTRDQVNSISGAPKVIFSDQRTTTIRFPGGGGERHYGLDQTGLDSLTPKITVPRNATDFEVTLSPRQKTVKSGQEVRFRATVTGTTGKLTYSWSFGDGSNDLQLTRPTVAHTFRGGSRSFFVTLTVTEEGNTRNGTASAVITIGKPVHKPEKPPGRPDRKPPDRTPPPGSSGGGNPAGGGAGGYPGGSYGTPAAPVVPAPAGPSVSPPASPPAAKQKSQPADDGLIPVRGELVGPPIPGEVIDPSSRPPAADSAQKAGEKGFGLSGEAKTALGVIALLGLGGLAELRSFSRLRSD